MWWFAMLPALAGMALAEPPARQVLTRADLPPQIRQLLEERSQWRGVNFIWHVRNNCSDGVSYERYYETRVVRDRALEVNKGDAEGLHREDFRNTYSETGKKLTAEDFGLNQYARPRRKLLYEGATWYRKGEQTSTLVSPRTDENAYAPDEGTYRPDLLGLFPAWRPEYYENVFVMPKSFEWTEVPVSYDTARVGAREIVSMAWEQHGTPLRLEWELDTQRGGLPVRSGLYAGNDMVWESRISLKQFGQKWYPAQVEMSEFAEHGGKVPYEVVTVDAIECFDPTDEDYEALNPTAALGVDLGHNIAVRETGSRTWDGTQFITPDEAVELVYGWGVDFGPLWVRDIAREMKITEEEYREKVRQGREEYRRVNGLPAGYGEFVAGQPGQAAEDEWERYTREFVERHKLEGERKDRAYEMLRQCQARRAWYLYKHRDDFQRLEGPAAAGASPAKDDGSPRPEATERQEKLRRLRQPIQLIFDRQLKPGVHTLLPKAERSQDAA
ncbi:MAG TPA: hypothetical protein PKK06_15820 [Phycisphaerae bacterium]|nr:hypothetical protein [Phycisphaerae bacterium]HNU47016.1 hypothetical protein [Phycisphaerae bacterium]